ncbi:TetR/AcrR family transcriptional regulator [uncultured Phenylobacterium sp.]|uniref:TetR/AcrR family transcriptional regulator n=1 Tax=uncultured Phenylobacterium sp. TaxID=349273 RepID=UPI0025DCA14C|nr:TetR/AcrR family transcriptional regulator [uncultured Phenylobacterium sp.]
MARTRGRPRSFDEAKLLQALTGVFWDKGYSGASLDDLQEAAGVSRPSLYTAFGDKRGMYHRVLQAFTAGFETHLSQLANGGGDLRGDLAKFYGAAIDLYVTGARGPRGCLVLCTATADAIDLPDAKAALGSVIHGLDDVLIARFRGAAAGRDNPAGPSPDARALHAAAILHSLALRARAGQSRNELLGFAESGLALLFETSGTGPHPPRSTVPSR